MNDLRSRAEQALRESAHLRDDGCWVWAGGHPHTEAEALAIAEACLLLDVPVTDRLTSLMWRRLVDKVMALEERVTRAEAQPQVSLDDPRFARAVLEAIEDAMRKRGF